MSWLETVDYWFSVMVYGSYQWSANPANTKHSWQVGYEQKEWNMQAVQAIHWKHMTCKLCSPKRALKNQAFCACAVMR
jgi:hypothetical protein